MSDDLTPKPWSPERTARYAFRRGLNENLKRRTRAQQRLDEGREELAALLQEGHKSGILSVSEMARVAGISRDTAHRLIREGGTTDAG